MHKEKIDFIKKNDTMNFTPLLLLPIRNILPPLPPFPVPPPPPQTPSTTQQTPNLHKTNNFFPPWLTP